MSHHPPFKSVEASRPDFEADLKPHFTKVPEPEWKAGGGLNSLAADFKSDNDGWKEIDPAEQEKPALYKLMIGGITPRPIAFLSTQSADGHSNLAPFSYFNMVSHNPPTIMISIQSNPKNASGLKDSAQNIRETKEFCCSIISEPFVEASNYTAIDAPPEIDEWALAGLTRRPSKTVKPPHVGESAFSMECELAHIYEVKTDDGTLSNTVVFGRVKRIHIKEFILDPEDPMKVQPDKLRAISRLGGITYGRTVQFMETPRPAWDKVKDEPAVKDALAKAKSDGMP